MVQEKVNIQDMNAEEIQALLSSDTREKAWLGPNKIMFKNCQEHQDMFLTEYRMRNAYEILLRKLEVGDEVTEGRDLVLVKRYFDMMFYPAQHLSLSQWKALNEGVEGVKDPTVTIVRAYKADRIKKNGKRPHEIELELSNGKTCQLSPGDIIYQYRTTRDSIEAIENSRL